MAEGEATSRRAPYAIILSAALLAAVACVFFIAQYIAIAALATPAVSIDEHSYLAEVAAAMQGSSQAKGELLITEYACAACHVSGDGRVAPLFAGIAERAGRRRPPLSAEQYLFESILYPGAFVLDGYANAMPANFRDRLTLMETGHIIAYLLTLDQAAADT